MPQTPLGLNALNTAGYLSPQRLDAENALQVANGGISSALNLTAGANLVKASAGRICRLVINVAGTAGRLSVYDAATTGAVAASNLVWTAVDTTSLGSVIELQWPCQNGIVVTVPTTGVVSVSYT